MKNDSKKYILAIETTGKISGVSISCDNKVLYESNLDTGLTHSVTLFSNIKKAIDSCNIDCNSIDTIKVSCGPGSFTGIRIGVAAALGLSATNNCKVEYVDTLDSLAYNTIGKNDYILSMIDAKVNRVYISMYEALSLKKISTDQIIEIESLISLLNTNFDNSKICFSLIGDGAMNYKNILSKGLKVNYKIYDKISNLKASSLFYVNGIQSKQPIINYMLASKAERDKYDKN